MGTYEKLLAMARSDMTFSQKLYRLLSDRKYSTYPYHRRGLGCNMSSINYGYSECEITRYLLDHNAKEAYEVVDNEGRLYFLKSQSFAFPPTPNKLLNPPNDIVLRILPMPLTKDPPI